MEKCHENEIVIYIICIHSTLYFYCDNHCNILTTSFQFKLYFIYYFKRKKFFYRKNLLYNDSGALTCSSLALSVKMSSLRCWNFPACGGLVFKPPPTRKLVSLRRWFGGCRLTVPYSRATSSKARVLSGMPFRNLLPAGALCTSLP